MKKVSLLAVATVALLITLGGAAYAQSTGPVPRHTLTIALNEQNGSSQSGTATLTGDNGQLKVSINLSNGTSEPQPAHIHRGTCANLDATPAYPLTSVVDGKSDTTLQLSLSMLTGGQYAINVHKSAAEAKVYVACGDVVDMSLGSGGTSSGGTSGGTSGGGTSTGSEPTTPGMPNTGKGDQTLLLALALLGISLAGAGLKFARRRA